MNDSDGTAASSGMNSADGTGATSEIGLADGTAASAGVVQAGARLPSLAVRSAMGDGRSTVVTNASMSSRQVRKYCKLDAAGEAILRQAMTELGLSARAHDKVLRVARTIADLEGADNIASHHIAEAVQYRRLDRKM